MNPWLIATIGAAVGLVIGSRPGRAQTDEERVRFIPVPAERRRDVER